jgi:hypothetical protein
MNGRVIAVGLLIALSASACSTTAGTTPSEASGATTTWSSATQIQPTPSSEELSAYGVSCPTDSFCTAVGENGAAHVWRDRSWSNAVPVPAGGTLTSVACPTEVHCVAVSAAGNSSTYDNGSWLPARPVGPAGIYRISCPTSDFCAAVGDSGSPGGPNTVATYDGSSWSTTVLPVPSSAGISDRLFDVSCATPSFCVAIDLDGSALVYQGRTWSPDRGPAMRGASSVSCPVRSFCMAVASGGYSTFDGTTWSRPIPVPGLQSAFVPDVSCPSTHSCTVVGLNGESSQWRNGNWSSPTSVFTGEFLSTVVVSCATPEFCMAVNNRGTAAHT